MKLNRNKLRKMILKEINNLNEASSVYELEQENIRQMMNAKNTIRFSDGLIKYYIAYDASGFERRFIRILEASDALNSLGVRKSTTEAGEVYSTHLSFEELKQLSDKGYSLDNVFNNSLYAAPETQQSFRAFVKNP